MADLSEREREVVVLRYFLGLSAVEAAQVLGSSVGAVRVATHRAVSRLCVRLTDVDLEEVADVS